MLISHPHRFIYTKTLKTAGTSVEIYFEDACLPPIHSIKRGHHIAETVSVAGVVGHRGGDVGLTWFNHMSATAIRDQVGDRIWSSYFKFCVVRNPFDKLVSYWWMFVTPEKRESYKTADFSVIRADFSRWAAESAGKVVDRHTYMVDGQPCVDFFIRHERLLEGIESVCRRIDYPFQPKRLGTYKNEYRANKRPFSEYYEPRAIEATKAAFGWELAHFGYTLT